MKVIFKTVAVLLVAAFSALFYYWHFGTKYGEPNWNDTKTHYLQAYKTFTPEGWVAMPGQGSDFRRGYYVLYHKDGKRLKRSKKVNIALTEIHWFDKEVIIMGDDDEPVWKLE